MLPCYDIMNYTLIYLTDVDTLKGLFLCCRDNQRYMSNYIIKGNYDVDKIIEVNKFTFQHIHISNYSKFTMHHHYVQQLYQLLIKCKTLSFVENTTIDDCNLDFKIREWGYFLTAIETCIHCEIYKCIY
jgi:hypothetical protein